LFGSSSPQKVIPETPAVVEEGGRKFSETSWAKGGKTESLVLPSRAMNFRSLKGKPPKTQIKEIDAVSVLEERTKKQTKKRGGGGVYFPDRAWKTPKKKNSGFKNHLRWGALPKRMEEN